MEPRCVECHDGQHIIRKLWCWHISRIAWHCLAVMRKFAAGVTGFPRPAEELLIQTFPPQCVLGLLEKRPDGSPIMTMLVTAGKTWENDSRFGVPWWWSWFQKRLQLDHQRWSWYTDLKGVSTYFWCMFDAFLLVNSYFWCMFDHFCWLTHIFDAWLMHVYWLTHIFDAYLIIVVG